MPLVLALLALGRAPGSLAQPAEASSAASPGTSPEIEVAGNRADATLTGPAEDLYLHLWGRPAPALAVTGDADADAAWSSVAP